MMQRYYFFLIYFQSDNTGLSSNLSFGIKELKNQCECDWYLSTKDHANGFGGFCFRYSSFNLSRLFKSFGVTGLSFITSTSVGSFSFILYSMLFCVCGGVPALFYSPSVFSLFAGCPSRWCVRLSTIMSPTCRSI